MNPLCMTFPPNKRAMDATEEEQLLKVVEECGEMVQAYNRGDRDAFQAELADLLAAAGELANKQPTQQMMDAIAAVLSKGVERGDWEACHD